MKLLNKMSATALMGMFAAAMLATAPAKADVNPFAAQDVVQSTVVAAGDKCGEGKCGEGKKAKGKCGEGKCGEGKKKGKGKCGEGKCGG